MPKDRVKLLLNMLASALSALPRGGDIEVTISGTLEAPTFLYRCRGTGARPPLYLTDFITSSTPPALDAMSIQAYYTLRLAETAAMQLEIFKDGAEILLSAKALA
jgi:histidine phosphotransferase ChpT